MEVTSLCLFGIDNVEMVGLEYRTVAWNRIVALSTFSSATSMYSNPSSSAAITCSPCLTTPENLVEVDITASSHLEAHAAVFRRTSEHRSRSVRTCQHLELVACHPCRLRCCGFQDRQPSGCSEARLNARRMVSHFDVVVAGCVAVFVGFVKFQVQRTVGRSDRVCRISLRCHTTLTFRSAL